MGSGGFMTRSRAFILVSLSLVAAVGAWAAVAQRAPEPAKAALLPASAALLPADAAFVAGVNVAKIVASPLYTRFATAPASTGSWAEAMKQTGVDPARDVDQILVAGDATPNAVPLALMLGRFDRAKVEAALAAAKGAARREHKGQPFWVTVLKPGEKESAAALLADGVFAAGGVDSLTAAIERRASGAPGLPANASLAALMERVRPGSAFWICGNDSLLATATSLAPGAGSFSLPQLKTLVVSGDVAPDVSASIVGETADATAAQNLANMLQAFVGIFAMQSGGKTAQLGELARALQVSHEGARVTVDARLSYETLEKLAARPTPVPPAVSRPTARPTARP
jgi:hypothetical protein